MADLVRGDGGLVEGRRSRVPRGGGPGPAAGPGEREAARRRGMASTAGSRCLLNNLGEIGRRPTRGRPGPRRGCTGRDEVHLRNQPPRPRRRDRAVDGADRGRGPRPARRAGLGPGVGRHGRSGAGADRGTDDRRGADRRDDCPGAAGGTSAAPGLAPRPVPAPAAPLPGRPGHWRANRARAIRPDPKSGSTIEQRRGRRSWPTRRGDSRTRACSSTRSPRRWGSAGGWPAGRWISPMSGSGRPRPDGRARREQLDRKQARPPRYVPAG